MFVWSLQKEKIHRAVKVRYGNLNPAGRPRNLTRSKKHRTFYWIVGLEKSTSTSYLRLVGEKGFRLSVVKILILIPMS